MFYHPNCAIEKPHQMAAGGGRVEYIHEFQLRNCIFTIHLCVYQCDALLPPYRPYAIPNVTKHKMDSGWKSGYYTAILSGKEDRSLWRLSTAKHFAGSLRQLGMQVSLFTSMSIRSS